MKSVDIALCFGSELASPTHVVFAAVTKKKGVAIYLVVDYNGSLY